EREYELVLRLGAFESWYIGNTLRFAATGAATRGDFLAAAAYAERARQRCMRTRRNYVSYIAYVMEPHRVHFLRARGLLAAGQVDEAMKEVRLCRQAVPASVMLPIDMVPALEKAGRKKEADELFGDVFALWEKTCTDYPQSALGHNDAAWLAVRCGR